MERGTVADPNDPAGARTYRNPFGTLAPAVADTNAFPCEGTAMSRPPDGTAVTDGLRLRADPTWTDPFAAATGGSCTGSPTALCLTPDRFRVEVSWRGFDGSSGEGRVVPLRSSDSGLFWFFDSDNWELLVKVLDACGVNGNFWLLSAATTNVEYDLTVTDTRTGEIFTVRNEAGAPAQAVVETAAFQQACARLTASRFG